MFLCNVSKHDTIILKHDVSRQNRKRGHSMKYKNRKTGKVGKVVHKGITTTLQFDDESELILSPANLKNDWVEIEDTEIEKLTYRKLYDIMCDYNRRFPNTNGLSAIIVYKQDNFTVPYTEEQRSYRVWNSNKAFKSGMLSNSLYGDCIDGSDPGVRLDAYNWSVEYCYLEKESYEQTLS